MSLLPISLFFALTAIAQESETYDDRDADEEGIVEDEADDLKQDLFFDSSYQEYEVQDEPDCDDYGCTGKMASGSPNPSTLCIDPDINDAVIWDFHSKSDPSFHASILVIGDNSFSYTTAGVGGTLQANREYWSFPQMVPPQDWTKMTAKAVNWLQQDGTVSWDAQSILAMQDYCDAQNNPANHEWIIDRPAGYTRTQMIRGPRLMGGPLLLNAVTPVMKASTIGIELGVDANASMLEVYQGPKVIYYLEVDAGLGGASALVNWYSASNVGDPGPAFTEVGVGYSEYVLDHTPPSGILFPFPSDHQVWQEAGMPQPGNPLCPVTF